MAPGRVVVLLYLCFGRQAAPGNMGADLIGWWRGTRRPFLYRQLARRISTEHTCSSRNPIRQLADGFQPSFALCAADLSLLVHQPQPYRPGLAAPQLGARRRLWTGAGVGDRVQPVDLPAQPVVLQRAGRRPRKWARS